MDRRTFIARVAVVAPISVALTRRAWDRTDVTVNHDGDKPVEITVVGVIVRDNQPARHSADDPLKLTTPVSFMVDVMAAPAIITARGNAFVRVTADHPGTSQHLMGRAPVVTLRKQTSMIPGMIELVGEPKGKP